MEFEWDEQKNERNQQKHGLGFDEAKELFLSGVDYLEIFDAQHSEDEDRFIAIGSIRKGIVVVVWTERDADTIRVISARYATKREESLYFRSMEKP